MTFILWSVSFHSKGLLICLCVGTAGGKAAGDSLRAQEKSGVQETWGEGEEVKGLGHSRAAEIKTETV